MRRILSGLMAAMMLLPAVSFAQATPQAPASWTAFQEQENAKRAAFFKELKADREAFLNANPDAKTYIDQVHATAKARMTAWRAAHPPKNSTITSTQ